MRVVSKSSLGKKILRKFKTRSGKQRFTNQTVCVKHVWHPGIRPQPFMAPALLRGQEFMKQFLDKRVASAINRGLDAAGVLDVAAKVCKQAAAVVRIEAVRLAPVRKGGLRRSIWVNSISLTEFRVGTNLFYAPFVEYGTGLYGPKKAKYLIQPKTKKCLAFTVRVPIVRGGKRAGGSGGKGRRKQ